MQATVASPVTLTDVLIMSSILSTARIIPLASRGRPNCRRMITRVMVPADGTAAAPTEATTARRTTCIY